MTLFGVIYIFIQIESDTGMSRKTVEDLMYRIRMVEKVPHEKVIICKFAQKEDHVFHGNENVCSWHFHYSMNCENRII